MIIMNNSGLKILVGIPTYAGLHVKATASLINGLLYTQRKYPESIIDISTVIRTDRFIARERLKDICMKGGYTYLFFIDDDIILCPDTLFDLLKHKALMVAPLCFIRFDTAYPSFGNFDKRGRFVFYSFDIPKDPFYQDGVGLCCCLIHRSVFDGAPQGIFFPRGDHFAEDISFFSLQNKLGRRVLIDPTIEVGHISQDNPVITRKDYSKHTNIIEKEK